MTVLSHILKLGGKIEIENFTLAVQTSCYASAVVVAYDSTLRDVFSTRHAVCCTTLVSSYDR